jgi:hypothetical protein
LRYRHTSSGLLVPIRPNERPRYRCNFPGCDWHGFNQPEQVAHARFHLREHEAELHDLTTPVIDRIMGEGGDPERQRYLERRFARLRKDVGLKRALDPRRY